MSYHKLTSQQKGVPHSGSDSWFISLGDLLTLLVCFFLLLTPQTQDRTGKDRWNQRVTSLASKQTDTGTDFAFGHKESVQGQRASTGDVMPVWKHNLQDRLGSHGERVELGHWVQEIRRRIVAGAVATVRFCNADVERDVITKVVPEVWASDALVSRVEFEVDTGCEAWRAHTESQGELVAVVTFSER